MKIKFKKPKIKINTKKPLQTVAKGYVGAITLGNKKLADKASGGFYDKLEKAIQGDLKSAIGAGMIAGSAVTNPIGTGVGAATNLVSKEPKLKEYQERKEEWSETPNVINSSFVNSPNNNKTVLYIVLGVVGFLLTILVIKRK